MDRKNELRFSSDGRFRLMLVGDIHEKRSYSGDGGLDQFLDYTALMNAALAKIRPDLVIFMGDVANARTPEALRNVIYNAVEPVLSAGVPFTVIFGNHDGESGAPQSEHEKIYADIPTCLYKKSAYVSDKDYCLPVLSPDGKKKAFNLWFVNSGNRDAEDSSAYACVGEDQIAWYEKTSAKLRKENGGIPLPSLLFQHIPVREEYRLLKRVPDARRFLDGVTFLGDVSKGVWVPDRKHTDFRGYLGEAPCTPDRNSGQFESWKKQGDVLGAFFGHDHMNDFTGTVDGIVLGQCKLAGFRPYGDGLRQGVRVIDLDEKHPRSFGTEMRYYREFFGTKCRSIHGRNKHLPDMINVKVDAARIIIPALGAAALAAGAIKKLLR